MRGSFARVLGPGLEEHYRKIYSVPNYSLGPPPTDPEVRYRPAVEEFPKAPTLAGLPLGAFVALFCS